MEEDDGQRDLVRRSNGRHQRGSDPLELRLDRWVSRGRELVDGVSGARPGSRGGRPAGLDSLGRWVGDKLDRLLDDGEEWNEPWQDSPPQGQRRQTPVETTREPPGKRRRLEAISRRGPSGSPPTASRKSSPQGPEEWPAEESFTVPRWERPSAPSRSASASPPPPESGGRPLPRSSRRRLD